MREEMNKRSIHNYKQIEKRYFERIKTDNGILDKNKEYIEEYYKSMLAEDLSPATIFRNLSLMIPWAKTLDVDFKKATNKQMRLVWRNIRNNLSLEISTRNKYRDVIRSFYRRLYDLEEGFPKQVQGLKKLEERRNQVRPEDLLSLQEINNLIRVALNPRDKALIALLADTGARIGEIGSLNIENIREDSDGFLIVSIPFGKTGSRVLPVMNCKPLLLEWLEQHPRLDGEKSPLFVKLKLRKKRSGSNGCFSSEDHEFKYAEFMSKNNSV